MLVGLAAAGDTEAEKLYRDAWWRESSKADYKNALDVYRKAVAAAGPATVRAKALLKVADLLKRLGRTEEAMVVLEDLRKKFPNEREVLATADIRAKEWTAIDLRQSYSEWYRRYLFSPEFQQRVVDEVLTLADGDTAMSWLLSIGDAAVPALQEAVKSKNDELVDRAIPLLLRLDAIPPAAVLLERMEWAGEDYAWLAILRADAATGQRLRDESKGATTLAQLIKAAATSPAVLLQVLAGDTGGRAAIEMEEAVAAILSALHATGDATIHAGIADLAVHPKSPAALRPLAAAQMLQSGWLGASAADWLEFARDADKFEWRRTALVWAGRTLQPDDGQSIDAILDDIADVGTVKEDLRGQLAVDFSKGLILNGRSLQLAWSPERLQRFFEVCLHAHYEEENIKFLQSLRSNRTRGSNVLEAFLLDPTKFAPDENDEMGLLWSIFDFEGDDPDDAFAAARWTRWAQRAYLRKWAGWNDKQRIAALDMAYVGLVGRGRAQRELAEAIDELNDGEVSDGVASSLKRLREREDDC